MEKVNNFIELLDIFSRNDTTDFSNIKIGKSIYRDFKDEPLKFNYDLFKFLRYEDFQYGERLVFHFNEENLKDLKFHNLSVFPKEAKSPFRMKMSTFVLYEKEHPPKKPSTPSNWFIRIFCRDNDDNPKNERLKHTKGYNKLKNE